MEALPCCIPHDNAHTLPPSLLPSPFNYLSRPPPRLPSGLLGDGPLQVPDLFDQVGLLVVELFVLRPVVLELAEELDELGLVLQQDVKDGLRLVWVGHKHLGGKAKGSRPYQGVLIRNLLRSVSL